VVAVVVAVIGIAALFKHGSSGSSPILSSPSTSPGRSYGAQVVLPFTGLGINLSVAADANGNVYVSDRDNKRVLKLLAAATNQSVLPFSNLNDSGGVAADNAGNVYVSDGNRVLKLAAGSSTPTELPFTGLSNPLGVAVDNAGNVYVTDTHRVLKLAAGITTELPFSGIDANNLAVDATGNVYVSDWDFSATTIKGRVLELLAGATSQTVLPFSNLNTPGVAVDTAGNVYVVDYNGLWILPVGATTPSVLRLTGLNQPHAVAVDGAGNVYVGDTLNRRVVKLPVG
jgi:serine/threonine-protein kinase